VNQTERAIMRLNMMAAWQECCECLRIVDAAALRGGWYQLRADLSQRREKLAQQIREL
jgi:hypothetical protein